MRSISSIYIILVLWFAGLGAAAQFAKMGLFLPELQQLFPDAGLATGFLITLISLVGALLGLIAGILVGQIGPRSVLLSGLVIGSLISLTQVFDLPLSVFLAARVIEGVSHLAIVVAAPTLMARYSSDRMRSSAMTLWGTFFGVSYVLTAALGLPLVSSKGIHALFLAHALILGVATILVVFVVPKNEPLPGSQSLDTFSIPSFYKQHKQAWSSPYVAAPAAGWLFYTITYVALLAILPDQIPVEQREFVTAAMPLASIVSSMTLGVALLWRYTAVQVVNIGFTLAICCALLFLTAIDKVLVCVLISTSFGLVQGASFAAIPQLNKTAPTQALAYGTLAQAGNIGNLCGTPLLLFLFNYGNANAMIVFIVVCYTAAICLHLIFSNRRH